MVCGAECLIGYLLSECVLECVLRNGMLCTPECLIGYLLSECVFGCVLRNRMMWRAESPEQKCFLLTIMGRKQPKDSLISRRD